jgi:addiction module HigA family antidote
MATQKLAAIHPGEVLLSDFLEPLGLSRYRLEHDISVPLRRINGIVHTKRAITADTALRLARYCGTSERFWLNLQSRFDLEVQRHALGARLEREVAALARASQRDVAPVGALRSRLRAWRALLAARTCGASGEQRPRR